MEAHKIDTTEYFYNLVKNASAEIKLEIIKRLSDSLKREINEPKDDSWKELFGAWPSDESAEELIETIRSSRFTDRQIEDLE